MNRFFYSILVIFSFTFNTFSQSDITIVKIHPVIGDTLDNSENKRFEIFPSATEVLQNAVFIIKEGKMMAILTLSDSTKRAVNYTYKQLLEDKERVDNILSGKIDLTIEKNKKNKKAKLRIVYNGRKKRIRRHTKIRFILRRSNPSLVKSIHRETGLIEARLLEVHDSKSPSITVRISTDYGGTRRARIPLNNIDMVRFNTPSEAILKKAVTIGYLTISFFVGRAAVIRDDPDLFYISAGFGILGALPLIKGNKKYEIGGNSRFEIFY